MSQLRLPEPIPFAELAERLVALPTMADGDDRASDANALTAFLARAIPTTSRRTRRRQR